MTRLFKLAAIAAALIIAALSLEPPSGTPGPTHIDKVMHFCAYAGLAGLIALGWPRARFWGVVLCAAGFGAALEIAQGLSGLGRTASALDALANLAGACLAVGLLWVWRRQKLRHEQHP